MGWVMSTEPVNRPCSFLAFDIGTFTREATFTRRVGGLALQTKEEPRTKRV
jgi:hypothetical protein